MKQLAVVIAILVAVPLALCVGAEAQKKALPPEKSIDINTATQEQLIKLPGVGPKKSEAIIEARPYANVDDLIKAKGIGPKTLERLRPYITCGGAAAPAAPAEAAPPAEAKKEPKAAQ